MPLQLVDAISDGPFRPGGWWGICERGRGLGDKEEGREINQQPIFLYSELK